MSWNRVSRSAVERFLDFSSGRGLDGQWGEVARRQLDGATALYNRLGEQRVAWLADEVGMGKTYVALGVVALLRHLQPEARVLILVPSSRLQPKWRTEIDVFTRNVVRVVDHRARTLQGTPGRPFHSPRNLHELGAQVAADAEVDLLAPLSAFSFGLGREPHTWRAAWHRLQQVAPALPDLDRHLFHRDRKAEFKRHYAAALNTILPTYDLVVVDESHNLKHGLGGASSRNQTLSVALGGSRQGLQADLADLVVPRVGRLLCLSATPVESDYDQLVRQAELFGLRGTTGFDVLDDPNAEDRKAVAQRFVVRRLNRLAVGGKSLTKNLYRREWRWGGLGAHDEAMEVSSDLDRLVLALVQKKVTEVLHHSDGRRSDGTFLRSFQMGMLSSFESFFQTVQGRVGASDPAPTNDGELDEEEEEKGHFDGTEQTRDVREKLGVDTRAVDFLCSSFRERFLRSLPHPKMDQVARAVDGWMADGEKSLVFVRRVKTVEELAGKIARAYDERMFAYLRGATPPSLSADLERAISHYRQTHGGKGGGPLADAGLDDNDVGGTDTFFAWYFRGSGEDPQRVGALFRRRQLQASSSRWSILFHDNPVRRLVGVERLPSWISEHRSALEQEARHCFGGREQGPWSHRFEAWQAAALHLLSQDAEVGAEADWLRRKLYPKRHPAPVAGEIGNPEVLLAEETLFSVLAEHPLGERVWPSSSEDGPARWQERELRRELLASVIRLGNPIVDLWLAAVSLTGRLDGAASNDVSPAALARRFLDQVAASDGRSGPAGWTRRELLQVGEHHDLIVSLNFPDVPQKDDLRELSRAYQAVLSRQAPVLGMHGGSKSEQAIKQFRMPGYPFAIVTTDILQEGVDLHTFCGRILHYGLTHTSSATEQRTGRIDRINSLVQRRLHREMSEENKLQVHYPHLLDTIEPLQVQVLYERMDRFVRLLHEGLGASTKEESRVWLDQAMRSDIRYPAPIRVELRSLFEVQEEDLTGDDFPLETEREASSSEHLKRWLDEVGRDVTLTVEAARSDAAFLGEGWLVDDDLSMQQEGARRQPFRVGLESRRDGRGLRLRIVSPVGAVSLTDGRTAGKLLRAQSDLCGAFVYDSGDGEGNLAVRIDVPLEPGADPVARLRTALEWALFNADHLEQQLLGPDTDAPLDDVRRHLDPEDDDDAE